MPAEDYDIFSGELTPANEKFIWARSFLAKLIKANRLNAPVERQGGAEGEIPVRVDPHESTGAELYILVSDIPIPTYPSVSVTVCVSGSLDTLKVLVDDSEEAEGEGGE